MYFSKVLHKEVEVTDALKLSIVITHSIPIFSRDLTISAKVHERRQNVMVESLIKAKAPHMQVASNWDKLTGWYISYSMMHVQAKVAFNSLGWSNYL